MSLDPPEQLDLIGVDRHGLLRNGPPSQNLSSTFERGRFNTKRYEENADDLSERRVRLIKAITLPAGSSELLPSDDRARLDHVRVFRNQLRQLHRDHVAEKRQAGNSFTDIFEGRCGSARDVLRRPFGQPCRRFYGERPRWSQSKAK